MFYAAFKDVKGNMMANIYHSWEQYFFDTFSPLCEEIHLLDFAIKGKTYKERKESLRNLAIDFQYYDSDVSGGLSWGELSEVQDFFEANAKRYGLLAEFRENAII